MTRLAIHSCLLSFVLLVFGALSVAAQTASVGGLQATPSDQPTLGAALNLTPAQERQLRRLLGTRTEENRAVLSRIQRGPDGAGQSRAVPAAVKRTQTATFREMLEVLKPDQQAVLKEAQRNEARRFADAGGGGDAEGPGLAAACMLTCTLHCQIEPNSACVPCGYCSALVFLPGP